MSSDRIAMLTLLVALAVPPAAAQSITMVTLGDSLTYGDGEYPVVGGYTTRLLALLTPDHPGSTLDNLAVSGFTSDDLVNVELGPAVTTLNGAPAGNLKMALVWIGSNDLFGLYNWVCDYEYGNNYPACEAATFSTYSSNISTILSTLSGTGAAVYVALLDDQSKRPVMADPVLRAASYSDISEEDVGRMSTQVGLYNAELAAQAATHGATTVDFFNTTLFEEWATLAEDGNHPNGAGYDVIAGMWYDAVTAGPSTLIFGDGFESGAFSGWSFNQP